MEAKSLFELALLGRTIDNPTSRDIENNEKGFHSTCIEATYNITILEKHMNDLILSWLQLCSSST